MTLIAAVRTPRGIAIAADSQETAGSHRRSVQKLDRLEIWEGRLSVIVAGSGDADLIDSFSARLQTTLPNYQISTLDEFVFTVETELQSFYDIDVPLSTAEDKRVRMFVAASIVGKVPQFDIWITKNVRLIRMSPDYGFVGWDETRYDVILSRLCQRPFKPYSPAPVLSPWQNSPVKR